MSLGLTKGASFEFVCLNRGIERLEMKRVTKQD